MQKQTERRDGDTGLGIPEFTSESIRELTPEEIEKNRKENEKKLRQQAELLLSEVEQDRGWRLPKPMCRFITTTIVIIACVLGLFLVTQAVQFASVVDSLSFWPRWTAIISTSLFGGVIVILMISLLWKTFRLNRSPQINLKATKILEQRQNMQLIVKEHHTKAKNVLEKYLQDFPISAAQHKNFKNMGFEDEKWKQLVESRKELLEKSNPIGVDDWLNDYERCFQSFLDTLAQKRIRSYAKRIGLGTAMSPIAIIDQMIVLYGCIAMIKDLMTIYNLRTAYGQSAVILCRSIIHTYLSGMIEEATESIAEVTADNLSEYMGESMGLLVGNIGAKTSEAALNGVLIWRLGRRSIKLLQPVRT